MRRPAFHSIVALAAVILIAGCSPTSQGSPGAAVGLPPGPTTPAPTAGPTQTRVPGFEDWQLINPQAVRVSIDGGALVMKLLGSVSWFDADQGVLFYRQVTGDFRATVSVRTSKASDPSMPPGQDGTVQLAGLMARTEYPAENYVFIASGSVGNSTGLEAETTESSRTITFQRGLPTSGDAELRLCRIGSTFLLWWRHLDSTENWTHMSTLDRKDMPETLQVGANMDTDAAPDVVARFEDLTIEPIPAGGGC